MFNESGERNINPTIRDSLNHRLSRAQFLGLMLGSVASLAGCSSRDVIADAPTDFQNEIAQSTFPIRRILDEDVKLHIFQRRDKLFGGRAIASRKGGVVEVWVPDFSIQTLRDAKVVAFHETVHMFNVENYPEFETFVDDEMFKSTGKKEYKRDEELQVITEGNYMQNPHIKDAGHPWTNTDELIASTLTVMRFYPNQLIENLRAMPDRISRRRMALTGLSCLSGLKRFSAIPVADNELPFAHELLAYLEQVA